MRVGKLRKGEGTGKERVTGEMVKKGGGLS